MPDLSKAIARTIKRLMVNGRATEGLTVSKLYAGLAPEFNRLNEYKRKVLAATVPNENMPLEALDDLEAKYGIENYLGFSDQDRINRVIERANGSGNGGADWLQEQIQQAGFPLYVLPNTAPGTDPAAVPGMLVVSSPPKKANTFPQYGSFEYGQLEYSNENPSESTSHPVQFVIPKESEGWGRFFFLSPFSGRLANNSELLPVTAEEFRYLRKLIIQTKYLRDWCILQVAVL